MPSNAPYPRRATLFVLTAVTLASGGIMLLGDRMNEAPRYALTPAGRLAPPVGACLAEESFRLINTDQERCGLDEVELSPRFAGDR
jgi:hypothetical protein